MLLKIRFRFHIFIFEIVIEINANLILANNTLKVNFVNILINYKYLDQTFAIYADPHWYTRVTFDNFFWLQLS